MNKKEVSEIKRLNTPSNCLITRIYGCYVDGEKSIKAEMKDAFLSMPEEDMFKYFEILRKGLTGRIGRNLINLDFPNETEKEGGTQEFLLKLRNSQLKDDGLLEEFCGRVIDSYDYVGNYLILLVHAIYDIPGKASDGTTMYDASDEIYDYIQCCICPVELSKPGLGYSEKENAFKNRQRDWVVGMPDVGFIFPAFNDRASDIHSTLLYIKKHIPVGFVEKITGCTIPAEADVQKAAFQEFVEEALGDKCDFKTVKSIHENLYELLEEYKDTPEPIELSKQRVKDVFRASGAEEDTMHEFDAVWEHLIGDNVLLTENVVNDKVFELKMPDVTVKVNTDMLSIASVKIIEGEKCLVIPIDRMDVNGITAN